LSGSSSTSSGPTCSYVLSVAPKSYSSIVSSTQIQERLIESPSRFPFRLRQVAAGSLLEATPRLEILRHGLDDDLVMLRKQAGTREAIPNQPYEAHV